MNPRAYAIGQAVFIRTDTLDYSEETIPFKNIDELVELCSTPRENCVLEKVVIYSMPKGELVAVTLGFISASKGQRPWGLAMPETEE